MLSRRSALSGLIALALGLAPPAAAQVDPQSPPPPGNQPTAPDNPVPQPPVAHVDVGIGDGGGSFLGDPLFEQLGLRKARVIVPYDVVLGRGLRDIDGWLQRARDQGYDVLVSFGFSQRRGRRWHLPSPREYRARVKEFMRRYPWIHEYTTWNEANHIRVQPTGKSPVRTAALYRTLRTLCRAPDCQTVAVDLLLDGHRRTWRWINAFKRRVGRGPHVWGLHNYPDANRLSSRMTRRFLRTVRGDVWFTETGGIVHFGRSWRRSERRATRALRQVFRLAELSRRVKRIYLYSWRAASRRWDSALLSKGGLPRPAYFALLGELNADRFNPRLPIESLPSSPVPQPGERAPPGNPQP